MTLDELHAQLVSTTRSMREAQRVFYRSRDHGSLNAAKALEAQVDRILREIDQARNAKSKFMPTFPDE